MEQKLGEVIYTGPEPELTVCYQNGYSYIGVQVKRNGSVSVPENDAASLLKRPDFKQAEKKGEKK